MDSSYCYKKNDMIIEREQDGVVTLIDPYRRTMMTLDPVGADIWRLCDGSRPLGAVVDALGAVYEADRQTLARDAAAFLEELVKRELVS